MAKKKSSSKNNKSGSSKGVEDKMKSAGQTLIDELTEHNEFFDMIVDMIPSKLYIAGESGDDFNPKYMYKQKEGAEHTSKEARRAAAKLAKRRKLDPALVETTVDKKKKLMGEHAKKQLPPPATTAATNGKKSNEAKNGAISSDTSGSKSRIEALREKLRAKIAEKQSLRPNSGVGGPTSGDPDHPEQISKRAARRAEKRRRQEEAKQRKNKKQAGGGNNNTNGATKYSIEQQQNNDNDPARDLAQIDFGRMAGLSNKSPNGTKNYLEANKALANLNKTKNIKKLLEDAEAKKQKLEELKRGSEEDRVKAKAIQWADTFKEADGTRVKDDPKKLKKVLKKKAAKKSKSQKAWQSRMEQTKSAKDERQKIRNHNLTARKQGGKVGANLSKKRIKDAPGGAGGGASPGGGEDKGKKLTRAGFEGRKQNFINGKQ